MLHGAAQGLDAVIVNPTFTLGPSSGNVTSMSIEVVRRFLQRRIPAYVDGGLNVVDVRDVAAGEMLADEKGRSGERYILGGRNFTMQRLFADLSRISGVPVPPLRLSPRLAVGGAQVSEMLGLGLGTQRRARLVAPRSGGPTRRPRRSASSGSRRGRTRRPSRRPSR